MPKFSMKNQTVGSIILVFFLVVIAGCRYNPPLEFVDSSENLAIDIEQYVAATLPLIKPDTQENRDRRAQGIWIIAKARQHGDYLTRIVNQSPLVDSVLELIRNGEVTKEEVDSVGSDLRK
jgi:hypothetical protein